MLLLTGWWCYNMQPKKEVHWGGHKNSGLAESLGFIFCGSWMWLQHFLVVCSKVNGRRALHRLKITTQVWEFVSVCNIWQFNSRSWRHFLVPKKTTAHFNTQPIKIQRFINETNFFCSILKLTASCGGCSELPPSLLRAVPFKPAFNKQFCTTNQKALCRLMLLLDK